MRKKRMVIIIYDNYELETKFHGTSDELAKCNRALTRHIKQQASVCAVLANASSYTSEPSTEPLMKPETRKTRECAGAIRREAKEIGIMQNRKEKA